MDALTFVFLLTTWSPETLATVDVADHNLSGTDCVEAVEFYNESNPMWTDGIPSCEIDTGDWTPHAYDEYAICADEACTDPLILPVCVYEDDDNCVWDANNQGNGKGESFYMLDGTRHALDLQDP